MATTIRSDVNVVRHDNHVAPASLTKRDFVKPINTLLIYNTSASSVSISFDGTHPLTMKAGGAFSMDFNSLKSYWTMGDGATTTLQVVVGSEY